MNLLQHYKENYSHLVKFNTNKERNLTCVKYRPEVIDFEDPYLRAARGLVLNEQGEVILRGFNKFFNWKQYDAKTTVDAKFKEEFTHMGSFTREEKVTFYEKLDGTCIIVGLYNGEYLFTTSSVIEHPDCIEPVYRLLNETPQVKQWLQQNPEKCLIFEYTSPNNLINVMYDEEKLTLIGVSEKATGDLSPLIMLEVAQELRLPAPNVYHMTIPEVETIQQEAKGIEGFVVVNEYGRLIKFKTEDWFMNSNDFLHPYIRKSSRKGVRRIIQAFANGTIDDMMARQAILTENGAEDKLTPVVECIEELLSEGQAIYAELKRNLDAATTEEEKLKVRIDFFNQKEIKMTNVQEALVNMHLMDRTFSELIEKYPARLRSLSEDILKRLAARGITVTIKHR